MRHQTELLGALGATEDNLIEYMEGMEGRLTEQLDELGTGQEVIINNQGEIINNQGEILGNQDDILGKLDQSLAQGATIEEAVQQVADDLGIAVDDLMAAMDMNTDRLSQEIADFRAENKAGQEEILDAVNVTRSDLIDLISENEAAGMSRDEALAAAIETLASDFNVSQDQILQELGLAKDEIIDAVNVTRNDLIDLVNQYEAAGMSRDEALGNAIEALASDFNVSQEQLLQELGLTEQNIIDAIGTSEGRVIDEIGGSEGRIIDEIGGSEGRIIDEIGLGTDILQSDLGNLGSQIGFQNLFQLLAQPGTLQQRVDVEQAPLAEIEDLYDFATIFRTPEDAAFFASALGEALESGQVTEDEILELLAAQ